MDQQTFEKAYMAYQSGNWADAATQFEQAKQPGEASGKIDHLRGNALMKLGRYDDAAQAYAAALEDQSYGMVGALATNRGRALVAAGRLDEAISSLQLATQDPSYATPYKAYMALGSACRAVGDVRNAGIAYRNAAIDESNPDPSVSLRKLGGCFMDLGRPEDAVESYRTALDFTTTVKSKNAVYCDLALAFMAGNRMEEAVDAFDHATADGTYVLSPEAQASYDAARNAAAARAGEQRISETDDLLAAAGYGYGVDPLDPTGETSSNLMPSPEDTGFFSVSEEQIVKDERQKRKRGRGGRIALVLVIVLLLIAGAAGFAYYSGFGWPTQEAAVEGLFKAKANHDDAKAFISPALDDASAEQIISMVPTGATITITGVNRSMSSSNAMVSARLLEGGEQSYKIELSRDGIGWKVSDMEPVVVSLPEDTAAANTSDASAASTAPADQAPVSDQSQQPSEAAAPAEAPAPTE